MKLVVCNGKTLTVRDVGDVLITLKASTVPIKVNGYHLMEDDKARQLLRELLGTDLYVKI